MFRKYNYIVENLHFKGGYWVYKKLTHWGSFKMENNCPCPVMEESMDRLTSIKYQVDKGQNITLVVKFCTKEVSLMVKKMARVLFSMSLDQLVTGRVVEEECRRLVFLYLDEGSLFSKRFLPFFINFSSKNLMEPLFQKFLPFSWFNCSKTKSDLGQINLGL